MSLPPPNYLSCSPKQLDSESKWLFENELQKSANVAVTLCGGDIHMMHSSAKLDFVCTIWSKKKFFLKLLIFTLFLSPNITLMCEKKQQRLKKKQVKNSKNICHATIPCSNTPKGVKDNGLYYRAKTKVRRQFVWSISHFTRRY